MTLPAARPLVPWYREPWPWLLMLGPGVAVIAGVITLLLALESNDGLVADDYYKQGLAINQIMQRDSRARELGYRAEMTFERDSGKVMLLLNGRTPPQQPLLLHLAHPTRSGMDQTIALTALGPVVSASGNAIRYAGRMASVTEAHWQIMLHDQGNTWRIAGEWIPSARQTITLRPGDY